MNNTEFRRMVLETPRRASDGSPTQAPTAAATPIGSRSRLGMPMTPRTVKGGTHLNFASQLAARNAASQPQKTFRSMAAPKGTKLAEGYRDRTQERTELADDEKAARIQALEEQMKLGQIDQDTFERLRYDIAGGDIGATHLIKGLDRKLLERVRRGEDVLGGGARAQVEDVDAPPKPVPDDEFEELEQKDIKPIEREKLEKKGNMAPPALLAGTKRSRNDILAELKASRKAAQEAAAASQLSSKFRKIGGKNAQVPRVERDERGREVLITVDEYGRMKRKVRKSSDIVDKEKGTTPNGLLVPDKKVSPLGMVVPEPAAPSMSPDDDDDRDIFEGVGDIYDPLGGAGDESDASSSDDKDAAKSPNQPQEDKCPSSSPSGEATTSVPSPRLTAEPSPKRQRNYFNNDPESASADTKSSKPFADPSILAALKRAADLAPRVTKEAASNDEDEQRDGRDGTARRLRLTERDRDLEDMDLGFGSSRFEDDEDAEGRGELAEWGEDGERNERGGHKQRKRGKKKRKGDKDSASDVLRIIEGRKGGGSK